MDNNRRLVAFGIAGIVLLGIVLLTFSGSKAPDPLNTTIVSPYTGLAVTGAPNGTGGDSGPGATATGQYSILGLSQLALPTSVKSRLLNNLSEALNTVIVPTPFETNIQLDGSTIKCDNPYDCRFSFYTDSPERYFAYHQYYLANGSRAYTIQQLPLAGGAL